MHISKLALSTALMLALTVPALADPIEGRWRTQSGETAEIAPCGGSFCITLKTGDHKGRNIGKLAPKNPGKYEGKITDPADDKTYTGKAAINGKAMKLEGCVLMFCKAQAWSKL